MRLELRPAEAADLEAAKSYFGPDVGDFANPAAQASWIISPTDNTSIHRRRAEWSCHQQKELLENDSSARAVKVVDCDNQDELVSLGRWHRYTSGYERVGDLEAVGLKDRDDPASWPEGINKALYLEMIEQCLAPRKEWMGAGQFWVLSCIVTREPLRKRGAASLILEWGLKQASEEGVPAFLEAAQAAKSLYEKHGFKEDGDQTIDCSPYGLPGVSITLSRMRADPA